MKKREFVELPVCDLVISEYNPRSIRTDDQVEKLANRISRNGFEKTRSLWVYKNSTHYEVFAGGIRLEAVRQAKFEVVPCVLHEGYSNDEIVQLAYQDNEDDEYHEKVSTVDVWANYASLAAAGWTQQRIAEAVGGNQGRVSERLNWHKLPADIKGFIQQEILDEGHLREITQLFIVEYFHPWLTTTAAQLEACTYAAKNKLTVRQTKAHVDKWRATIDYAQECYEALPVESQSEFVELLAEVEARNQPVIQKVYSGFMSRLEKEARERELELARQQQESEKERIKLEHERKRQERISAIMDCYHHANGLKAMEELDDDSVSLIFTDPPYDRASVGLYGQLAEIASKKLKPGGNLLCYAGHHVLPEIFSLMTPHLRYWWILSLDHGGSSARMPVKKVFVHWKPILWFVKEKVDLHNYVADQVRSSQPDKKSHEWQQDTSEALYYIEQMTGPDDFIVDPFAGSGTTLLAALQLNRRCVGFEIDATYFEKGQERIYGFASATSSL